MILMILKNKKDELRIIYKSDLSHRYKKVPKEQRDKLLIVTNSLNEIIWVIGYYKKKTTDKESLILSFKENL